MHSPNETSTIELFIHVGVFDTRSAGESAVRALRATGIDEDRIGILSRDREADDFGLENDPTHSRWEEGTAIGAVVGGLTGTGLGLLVVGGLMPGIGPAIAGGMLVALLASAGAGATAGTVIGGLIGLGIPEHEAGSYYEHVAAGRTIVAVRTDGPAEWVEDLFRRHGAVERGNLVTPNT